MTTVEPGYEQMKPEGTPRSSEGPEGSNDGDHFRCETPIEVSAACKMSQEEAQALYDKMLNKATDHHELPEDVWGAMHFIIIKDVPDMLNCDIRRENLMRTCFVTVCYTLNIGLQMALLYWICSMVTLPAVRQAQNSYRDFHGKAFHPNGKFDQELFKAIPRGQQEEICQIALNSKLFLSAILFLWVAQCFSELRSVSRRVRLLGKLPGLPEGFLPGEMVAEAYQGHGIFKERKHLNVCMNGSTRCLLMVLIFIPKTCIAMLLCVAGCVWLTASLSFGDLILNSLALAFVVGIDELIFLVFLPPRLAQNLSDTVMALPVDESKTWEELDKADVQGAYTRSAQFLVAVIAFVGVFVRYQPVLPGFQWDVKDACSSFNADKMMPFCPPWDGACFPVGSS